MQRCNVRSVQRLTLRCSTQRAIARSSTIQAAKRHHSVVPHLDGARNNLRCFQISRKYIACVVMHRLYLLCLQMQRRWNATDASARMMLWSMDFNQTLPLWSLAIYRDHCHSSNSPHYFNLSRWIVNRLPWRRYCPIYAGFMQYCMYCSYARTTDKGHEKAATVVHRAAWRLSRQQETGVRWRYRKIVKMVRQLIAMMTATEKCVCRHEVLNLRVGAIYHHSIKHSECLAKLAETSAIQSKFIHSH